MTRSEGYRCNTRHLFKRAFRGKGPTHISTYLTTFRLGDHVTIKANSSIHKGMPHKYYHGKTGRVWNITPRAVGVEVNKRVRNQIMRKKIHVRIEHVKKSKCREDFLRRAKENQVKLAEARAKGEKFSLKREPGWPKAGVIVAVNKPIETIKPVPYEFLV